MHLRTNVSSGSAIQVEFFIRDPTCHKRTLGSSSSSKQVVWHPGIVTSVISATLTPGIRALCPVSRSSPESVNPPAHSLPPPPPQASIWRRKVRLSPTLRLGVCGHSGNAFTTPILGTETIAASRSPSFRPFGGCGGKPDQHMIGAWDRVIRSCSRLRLAAGFARLHPLPVSPKAAEPSPCNVAA